jgi:tetratricopeptide (TPR) repeat protein
LKVWDSASGQPQKAEAGKDLWETAVALHLEEKFAPAEEIYCQLLEQNPKNSGLLATLGSLYSQTNKIGLGIHFLQAAVDEGMDDPDVYTNLALALQKSGQREKAAVYYEKSIAGESTPEALTNYSGLFIESGNPEKCIALCEKAIKGNPDMPIAHWNLALALLGEGHWDRAWDEHEWGLKPKCLREDRAVLDIPVWDGTPGKTVTVYGEQGLGDEIMFASMLPDLLKTNPVVLECHPRLETLFKKSFPGMPVYGTREAMEVSWPLEHQLDYRIAIGSLGKFYRRSRDAFPGTPYLKADALPKGEKFRVGISWKGGGAKMGRVQKRSVPLTWWKPILETPNVEFVSLQYGIGKEEDLDVMDALGYDIKRFPEADAKDYYETARLVSSCDLVITICTSVVHVAGALGVPCWVLTPKNPAWRYQNKGGMPWYRSVRLYRSPDVEQPAWRPVVDLIGADLDELVNGKQQLQRTA